MDPETMQPRAAPTARRMGEVMFRGNIVMKGYLKNPKATAEAFAGGWFHSGDLGVLHPDGYIQLKDRSKDIIISGGENISSIEVEDALYKHPAVQAAAVVAKPDEKWGETPCAFVELKPGQARHAGRDHRVVPPGHLARYKVPAARRVRRAAQDLDRQDPEVQAARHGQGRVATVVARLAHVTYLVRDYDEAIDWFTRCLSFALIENTDLGQGKRWVLVGAQGGGSRLLLARAEGAGSRRPSARPQGAGLPIFCKRMISPATMRRCWPMG